jgi:nucleoside diphosphate kinase
MTSDYAVGLELIAQGQDAITKWRTFIGPTNSIKAR